MPDKRNGKLMFHVVVCLILVLLIVLPCISTILTLVGKTRSFHPNKWEVRFSTRRGQYHLASPSKPKGEHQHSALEERKLGEKTESSSLDKENSNEKFGSKRRQGSKC
ncbi:hypothetical protein K1719_000245 [Acacia pycnantha]|nr:hypothetical protein K1719_000245 [Acacia pycnantha]